MNTHLTVRELNLAEDEKVTAFQYRFGTVRKGFTEVDSPAYLVQVGKGLSDGEEIRNHIRLSGEKLGITHTKEDETVTLLVKPQPPGSGSGGNPVKTEDVPTGDASNVLVCLAAVCVSGAALIWLLAVVRRRRKNLLKFFEKSSKIQGGRKP